MEEDVGEYPVHKAVFDNDLKKLSKYLRKYDVGTKDKHGNTGLHLAVMLGRKECVQLLLNHDAPVKVKNGLGWTVLAEAVSYGHRPTIVSLVRKFRQQSKEQMEQRRPNLVAALNKIDSFYMELKWDFQSWVPLVSRILPSDVCKIYKCGANIRLDTTLVDFSDMRWERGDISFIFRGDADPTESLTVMDNVGQLFQRVRYEENEMEIEDEVNLLMSTDILAAQISTKKISFSRAQSGWIFREDRKELVSGQYDAELYTVHGLSLESRKRREHLSSDDLEKNKALLQHFTKGTYNVYNENIRRTSLTPPPEKNISWEEYINAEVNNYPRLGRDLVYKESSKHFKATVAMSNDFPLSVEMLLNVLEVIAPFKHFSKLRDFINTKLPSGFPVKIELPILPTVTAKITFQEFEFRNNISPSIFEVPRMYQEDPSRYTLDYVFILIYIKSLHFEPKPQFLSAHERSRVRPKGRLRVKNAPGNQKPYDGTSVILLEMPMLFTLGSVYGASCLVYVE